MIMPDAASTDSNPTPVFPFYIDEEMVTSFLATIEGGLSIVEKVSQTFGSARHGGVEGSLSGSGGIPIVGKAKATGSAGRYSESSSGEQWEFQREHTLISLLNLLRQLLIDRDITKIIEKNPSADLQVGDVIEYKGSIINNPFAELTEVWNTYLQMRPYFTENSRYQNIASGDNKRRSSTGSKPKPPSTYPIGKDEERIQMILNMSTEGIENSGLLDIYMHTPHDIFTSSVLTLRLESSPSRSLAFSTNSECTIIGKITGIIQDEEEILMYRRSGLRMFPSDLFREIFKPFKDMDEVLLDLGEVAIPGPALQVLPLAIFV